MRYATIKYNDVANAPGVNVSIYLQGCPHHCPKCFNPETWNFNGGLEFTSETLDSIIQGLSANNIKRDLCILGGEPLCAENAFLTALIIKEVKVHYPDIKIYVWTGYIYENLLKNPTHPQINYILDTIDVLVDGPYVDELRDITLKMRGSSNQRIIELREGGEKK